FRYRRKVGGVTTPAESRENVFCCEVKFCDPLQKFVTYVCAQATATLWVRIPTTLRPRPGGHEPRPGGRGAATGGANVDDAFRHSIRNFALVILRRHRFRFLTTDCLALPSRSSRAFAVRPRAPKPPLARAAFAPAGRKTTCLRKTSRSATRGTHHGPTVAS